MTYLNILLLLLFTYNGFAAVIDQEPITPISTITISDPAVVELGQALFHDPRLSADGSVSCASCHDLKKGGVDGLTVSVGINKQLGSINAPTVFNSSLNIKQFWDGRALTLADQIDGPIQNPKEMAASWPHVLNTIKNDASYVLKFNQLFDDGITINNIKQAIVRFEESLLTPNSRFDQYLMGDEQALSLQELHGYRLFKNYGCISCHQGAGIGGNMFQKLGVMKAFFSDEDHNQVDLGRFNITHQESDRYVFKVPSLRNVALTAPYLHDGSAQTLDDVVRIMMTFQLGINAPNEDVEAIVQFLTTLTGEYQGQAL